METFWLYYGSRLLTSVRMPIGSTDPQVIAQAIENHENVPIGHEQGEAPFEFRNRLRLASVRTY
jgi:hypothetical protein